MMIKHACFYFFLYMSLSACSFSPSTPEEINKDIDALLENNKYDEINSAINSIDKSQTQFKPVLNRSAQIQTSQLTYIKNTSESAKKDILNNKWQSALNTYNNALENIQNETQLTIEKKQLLQTRDQKVVELRKELLLKQAHALITYKKIYSQLHELIPEDYSAKFDISRYEKDAIEISLHLEKCAQQAIQNKQYHLAKECYSLSNQLNPSKLKSSQVADLDNRLKQHANQQRMKELLDSYKSAYSTQQYNDAKMYLNILLQINPDHKQAKKHLSSLNIEIEKWVLNKTTTGKDLYSQKKINEALALWKQAIQIQPENKELIQLISRAEKVSKKLESLEQAQ